MVEPGAVVPVTPFAPRTGVLVLRCVPGVTEPGVGETLWSGRMMGGVLALLVVLPVPPAADDPPVSVSDGKLAGGVELAGAGVCAEPPWSVDAAGSAAPVPAGRLDADLSSGRFTGTRWGVTSLLSGALVPNGLR